MQLYDYLKNKMPIVAALGVFLGLSSCGSYQYAGYDDDIYGQSDRRVEYQEQRVDRDVEQAQNNNTYYKNYFAEKSQELDAIAQENEIFTDIDAYEGSYTENDSLQFNPTGFAGWGQANDQVVINVYDNGWNNWGWGWNNWGWNNWGWNNWGWNRWNNWGWNRWNRWGFGWNNWGWGYDPFWCPPGFYGGYAWYGNPYWNRGFNRGYYGRSLAYNAGRRGSLAYRGSSLSNRNGYSISRRNGTSTNSRYNLSRRSNSSNRNSTVRPRRSSSNIGTRVNSPRRNNSSIRRNGNTVRRNNSSNMRRSTPRRSSSSNRSFSRSSSSRSSGMSRSSSSSRSSGMSRSSSSSRSSGSSRSGGRRN